MKKRKYTFKTRKKAVKKAVKKTNKASKKKGVTLAMHTPKVKISPRLS